MRSGRLGVTLCCSLSESRYEELIEILVPNLIQNSPVNSRLSYYNNVGLAYGQMSNGTIDIGAKVDSGQERFFIFPNVATHNGSFSVNYLFPGSGSYQVLSRINSKGFLTLGSFSIFVPIQVGVTTSTSNVSLLVFAASIAGIIGILTVVALKYIKRKRCGDE